MGTEGGGAKKIAKKAGKKKKAKHQRWIRLTFTSILMPPRL
jgi:hypothetical protein